MYAKLLCWMSLYHLESSIKNTDHKHMLLFYKQTDINAYRYDQIRYISLQATGINGSDGVVGNSEGMCRNRELATFPHLLSRCSFSPYSTKAPANTMIV